MNNDFMNRVNAIMLEQQQPPAQDQYGAFAEMVPRHNCDPKSAAYAGVH